MHLFNHQGGFSQKNLIYCRSHFDEFNYALMNAIAFWWMYCCIDQWMKWQKWKITATCPLPPSCENITCSQSGLSPWRNWVTVVQSNMFSFWLRISVFGWLGSCRLRISVSIVVMLGNNKLYYALILSQDILSSGITKEGSWRLGIRWFGQWSSNSRSTVT